MTLGGWGAAVLHPYIRAWSIGCARNSLRFFHLGGPGHLEALLDALVHRTIVFVIGEGAVGFGAFSFGNFEMVPQLDGRDAEGLLEAFDAPFDVSFQIV